MTDVRELKTASFRKVGTRWTAHAACFHNKNEVLRWCLKSGGEHGLCGVLRGKVLRLHYSVKYLGRVSAYVTS